MILCLCKDYGIFWNWPTVEKVYFEIELRFKIIASAGNRTRIYCLEGNNANLYTTDALFIKYDQMDDTDESAIAMQSIN